MIHLPRFLFTLILLPNLVTLADDWPRFRGLAGSGIAYDSDTLPTVWSPTQNLAWKIPLPGPGASSPIIVGGRVFVTSYSGYGLSRTNPGEIEDLVRHLTCVDLRTGKVIWQRDAKASLPEDSYDGTGVSSHGYASHTPVSDGNSVFAFFGKGGVYAFGINGDELWHAQAGKESDPPRWGSSSSPVLFDDLVIVTASAESQSIIAFDKETGIKRWQHEASGLDGMWGTPTLVSIDEQRTDLVMMVASEIWGIDPRSGKLRWYSEATKSQQAYTSIVTQGNRIFACSGQGGGSIALNGGGRGDVTATNIAWKSPVAATYASPLFDRGRLYLVSRGVLTVMDGGTGNRLQQIRLKGARRTGNSRFGALDYASPVIVGDRLFFLNASGQMFVFRLGKEVENLAVNEVTPDREVFWGSPALSDGRMVIRSSKHLYCIGSEVGNLNSRTKAANNTGYSSEERQFVEIPGGNLSSHSRLRGSRLKANLFDLIDTDGDGKLTHHELNGRASPDQFRLWDKDQNDLVTRSEFLNSLEKQSKYEGKVPSRRPDRARRPPNADP